MVVMTIADVKQAVAGRETQILDALNIKWRDGRPHVRCPYMTHLDKRPSWRWDSASSVAFCTCTVRPQSIFDVYMRTKGGDLATACDRIAELIGRPDLVRGAKETTKTGSASSAPFPGCTIAEYASAKGLNEDFLRLLGLSDVTYAHKPAIKIPYRATGGTEVAIRYRVALDGPDRFRWSKGSKAILYGLERLSEAKADSYVVIVEGESDCQTLWLHGFPAIGLPGAQTFHEDRDAPLLDGIAMIYVVIEPDTGGAAVLKWLKRSSIAPRTRLVRLPVKDPNALHLRDPEGFRSAFQQALEAAEQYVPPGVDPKKDDSPKAGRALVLHEPEPWPDPVDGARLLDDIVSGIRRYVVLGEVEADAVAAWCVATHGFLKFSIFPRVLISSVEKRSGKTTTLDCVERLVPRALVAANITAPALYRVIEGARPCLLLDEADSFIRDSEDLRGIINAGHRANGMVIRAVESGKNYEPRQFSVYSPLVIAGIGRLAPTIEDRAVIIKLKRRRPDEPIESLRLDKPNGLDELSRKAARFVADHGDEIRDADPVMPNTIYNRAADNWRPLLTIADAAGGDWPGRARRAAIQLDGEIDDGSSRVQLLGDLRATFAATNTDRVFSDDLIKFLVGLEDRPWAEIDKGRPITKNGLAARLRVFGISPATVRIGADTAKGYKLEQFRDAFARYLSSDPASENVTTSQGQDSYGSQADSETAHVNDCDVSESAGDAGVSAGCDGVTDSREGGGEDERESPPWETTI